MAVAVVQDWIEDETERSTKSYDTITERLQEQGPVDGLIVHTAGFTGTGFRIFEVWETQGHFDRFLGERLMPLLLEVEDGDPTPPQVTAYELHHVITA
jgi:hypothetical protein